MKLRSLKDIDELASVLDVSEVNDLLIELVGILVRDSVSPVEGADSINDIIGRQSYNEIGLSSEASNVVLSWVKNNYGLSDERTVLVQIANLANLTSFGAKSFLEHRLSNSSSELEKKELIGALKEINICI